MNPYKLSKHQLDLVKFCQRIESEGEGGGIIADEMGMGKTLSMTQLVITDGEALKALKALNALKALIPCKIPDADHSTIIRR